MMILEIGAGMGLLNFTSFLSEGAGIAMVGGPLSIRLLNQNFLSMMSDLPIYIAICYCSLPE